MDNKLSTIINKLSVKYQIPTSKVEDVVNDFFKRMRKAFKNSELPTIMISKLGKFEPDVRKIKNKVKLLNRYLQEPEITEEQRIKYSEQLTRFNEILDRVKKEKHTRND